MKHPNKAAEQFVERLLTEGDGDPCDRTKEGFDRSELPDYYDEKLFKRGQKFFHDNIFSMTLAKFLGLICVIALPDGLKILVMTKMASTDLAAYKRYVQTLQHILVWYDNDFYPGSKLWASIKDVKSMHNAASGQCFKQMQYRISQRDMALTQFGFMGFPIMRSEMMGIHNPKDEDLKGLIHMWRVIGYVLGIDDKFNLCRESLQETKDICNILNDKVFYPLFEEPVEPLVDMVNHIVDGFGATLDYSLNYSLLMTYLHMVLLKEKDYEKITHPKYKDMHWSTKLKLSLLGFKMWALQYSGFRYYENALTRFKIWLSKNFPIVAYVKFGLNNAHVSILQSYERQKVNNQSFFDVVYGFLTSFKPKQS